MVVTKIKPDIRTRSYSLRDDEAFAFVPFCCQQQVKGGKPWIGFVFLCEVADGPLKNQEGETKDIRWIKKSELRRLFEQRPESFFTLQLGVLDYYFNCNNAS